MANELTPEVLQHLARLGAQARLEQLETERRAILQAFPGLGGARRGRKPGRRPGRRTRVVEGAPAASAAAPAVARAGRPRKKKRSHMSPAARKAQSERMKRLWAERRKAKAKAASKE